MPRDGRLARHADHHLDECFGGSPVPNRGGESASCEDIPCYTGVDQLVLGADATTAAHTFFFICWAYMSCTTTEQIVATDSTGTHTLDSITTPRPKQPHALVAKPARAIRTHPHLDSRR
jgi:hypothetical protein